VSDGSWSLGAGAIGAGRDLTIGGSVHVGSRPRVRSAYRERVREIAPPDLVDRDKEFAELTAWCLQPDAGYVWWRAPAWAGKSALMSWLVLHPPPGVRVVSFFITARYASQNDRIAFTDLVIEQLCDLLGEALPPLTDSTRDTQFLGLLHQAAEQCRAQSERLLLVVDGLDEDAGVHGPAGHSIAALLPSSPPADMRILVAGRVNPPIPPDVPPHHPLRGLGVVRTLTPSRYAAVIRGDMERELDQLLTGSPDGRDLLGLLTAAGGGLSGPDLAELTGQSPRKIERLLGTVAGRSFTLRGSRYQPGQAPDLYLLGHEELRAIALDELGARTLDSYRQQIHTWAERYRTQHWPVGTPEYLLRGYHQMLHSIGDLPRMTWLATDRARHDRMLDISGGDTAALTEIHTTQQIHADQDKPDLNASALLALHRDALTARNINIPTILPSVWATLGHLNRAEALARTITDPDQQAQALADLAGTLATAGQHDQAETLARTITHPYQQAWALARLADTLATAGQHDQAETLARTITNPYQQARALGDLAGTLATAGQHDRARTLAASAETLARTITNPDQQAEALADLAGTLATAGQHERGAIVLARALAIGDWRTSLHALAQLAPSALITLTDNLDLGRFSWILGGG
jgi:tetratricopeptide (TPR) repeat protein